MNRDLAQMAALLQKQARTPPDHPEDYRAHAGVKNFADDHEGFVENVPLRWKSKPDQPESFLAYITDAEAALLRAANVHGKLDPEKMGQGNVGPGGVPSFDDSADGASGPGDGGGGDGGDNDSVDVGGVPGDGLGTDPDADDGDPEGPGGGGDASVGGGFGTESSGWGLAEVLTAPIETLLSVLPGIDVEMTGKDVLGFDMSRSMAGLPGQQPPGVEVNPGAMVGGLFGPIGEIAGSMVSPTVSVNTSGNVSSHGGLASMAGALSAPTEVAQDTSVQSDAVFGQETDDEIGGGYENAFDGGPVGSAVATPEQTADQVEKQLQLAKSLFGPGYTRAGVGTIYL